MNKISSWKSDRLTFRLAVYEDLPAIVGIYNSTVASRKVTADLEPVSVESRLGWFEQHSPDKRPLWIAADATGKMVGWASFSSFYGRPAYDITAEISIYLDESERQKGYGKEILTYCLECAPLLGITNVLAFIFSRNTGSLRLFRSFGFEEWGNLPEVAVLEQTKETLLILGKKIDSGM